MLPVNEVPAMKAWVISILSFDAMHSHPDTVDEVVVALVSVSVSKLLDSDESVVIRMWAA
ncbi:MAG: hypothetical protein ACLPSW_19585, partial [Roseiarcus sp.]